MRLNQKIRLILEKNAEEKYKNFAQKLNPNVNNILGVRIPLLRKIAKQIALHEDWKYFLDHFEEKYYEEILLFGMVIGYSKVSLEEALYYLSLFIPKINNWAVCDCCCSSLHFVKQHQEKMLQFITPYINSPQEYENRFVAVLLLSYFLDEKHINTVLEILAKIRHEGYYAKMGVAWAFSVCLVKFTNKTLAFFKSEDVHPWILNKTIQKSCESFRISPQLKQTLKLLKK